MSESDDGPDIDLTVGSEALDHARERREALGDAADVLEAVLATPGADPQWTLRVADALQGLRHAFQAHCEEVESDSGLLPRLQRESPRLSNAIRRMEREHITIAVAIDDAAQLVSDCGGDCDADAVESIRERAVDVLRAISRHRQRGADLVYEAYHVDIGSGWG